MKPALVLKEMKELRESWRKQAFHYTTDQQKRYDELLKLRRERVKWFHDNDRVPVSYTHLTIPTILLV